MKRKTRSSLRSDVLAASLILASVLVELSMRELFHRMWSEVPGILGVLLLWLCVLLVPVREGLRRRARWSVAVERERRREGVLIGPLLIGTAAAVWVQVVCGPWLVSTLSFGPVLGAVCVTLATVLGFFVASRKLSEATWSGLRRSTSAAMVIFVLTQPVLANFRAPDVIWPSPEVAESSSSLAPETQVFVLLDELNDKAASSIMAAMARSGRTVHRRTLIPVAGSTAKVVPTLFAHRPFPEAKPCSSHAICSGTDTLDFSRIHAGRPDIDVVGFYLPYCAIQGLRSCHRETLASPVLSLERWVCALLRRSDVFARLAGQPGVQHCRELSGRVVSDLVTDVEKRIWQAPVWRDGGVLFVHIPLPHPSGRDPAQGLAAHYTANLDRAAHLIGRMAATLGRDNSRSFSMIVFSDHPLRPAMWCEPTLSRRGVACVNDATLVDDRVPLLLTGNLPPAFHSITGNEDIFRLMRSMNTIEKTSNIK